MHEGGVGECLDGDDDEDDDDDEEDGSFVVLSLIRMSLSDDSTVACGIKREEWLNHIKCQ
jgi:hypothetical protein